ncbi:MAG: hypothetical protein ACRC2J_12570, partial [Microcoleaceae cyanobacterium]
TWYYWTGELPYNVIPGSSPGEGWKLWSKDLSVIAYESISRSYGEAGLNVNGFFIKGSVVRHSSDVLIDPKTGRGYSYLGTYPHIVAVGEGPNSPNWNDKTTELLRNKIASPIGTTLLGAGQGKTQADVNTQLTNLISNLMGMGVVNDFGYWGLSSNNTTPGVGEFSCDTGYLGTGGRVTFHQTDKNNRDMNDIIGLMEVGNIFIGYSKLNSGKRTVMKITEVTKSETLPSLKYELVSHTGTNVNVGDEYKFIFPIPAPAIGYLLQAPNQPGPYVQNNGLWEKIKPYELGRVMFTVSGSSFTLGKKDKNLIVSWSQVRLCNSTGIVAISDVSDFIIPPGNALYIDLTKPSPYEVFISPIEDIVADSLLGNKIILVGNYISGFIFGELSQSLVIENNNKNTRRIVAGTITSSSLSGGVYTITTGVGRSFVEKKNGSHEYEIAVVENVKINPGQALVVDFSKGLKNSSGQFIPTVESISSNLASGWISDDKYLLFGTTGKSGATFGVYRFAISNNVVDDYKIVIQKSSPTFMNIIMKTVQNGSDKYIRYHMDRRTNPETRSDVWRINTVHEVTRAFGEFGFSTGTEICSSGEFEFAVQEVGKSDYMGGWRHGDDELVKITMLADGIVIDESYTGNLKCDRFEIIQKSELLEVDNPERVVRGLSYRRWVYEEGKLELFNHVVFNSNLTLKVAFFNMFPIHRLAPDNSTVITDKVYRSPMYEEENVGIEGFPITFTQSNIIKYTGPNGWSGEVEVIEGWDKPGRNTWIQNTTEYNKGYFDYTGSGYNVLAGESLTGRAIYRIFSTN